MPEDRWLGRPPGVAAASALEDRAAELAGKCGGHMYFPWLEVEAESFKTGLII